MKINIPKKYQNRFQAENIWIRRKDKERCDVREYIPVYITRWQNHSVLLMNHKERDRLTERLDDELRIAGGARRFIKAGIIAVEFKDGFIELPGGLAGWLKDDERSYEEATIGLLIK